MMRLASPMSSGESHLMGGKRITALTSGASNRAARSGFSTAQFFGTASKKTKITTTSKTMPRTHPQGAEEVRGHDADQGGRDQLADQDQQQSGFKKLRGSRPAWPA